MTIDCGACDACHKFLGHTVWYSLKRAYRNGYVFRHQIEAVFPIKRI
jgi:hypothetical protein